jgi:hypothetical protein
MRRLRGKLTYANVMSTVAVFLALGGSVYAAGKLDGTQIKPNSIPGNRLKRNSVTGARIKASTLGTVPFATNAANASTLAGNAAAAFAQSSNLLSAVVENKGTNANFVRGTPGTTATRLGVGEVIVRFPRKVSQCTWVASVGHPGLAGLAPGGAGARGPNDEDPNSVEVITWDSTGVQTDADFHLIVLC